VDAATRDDAAVFQLSPERALVATVDFFAPVVDDAYSFGAIAAANAFSDLYAMGATPLIALNIVAWPRRPEILALLGEVLRGGADVAAEAGALIVGGHSIDDPEPKYGMVAIGDAHPQEILVNSGARPGDALVLTKPLGTGIITTALKRDLAGEAEIAPAVTAMRTLNRLASEAVRAVRGAVHAVTDVTGFGLIGHLSNILAASRVGARLRMSAIPLLPHARELAGRGAIPGGTERNAAATAAHTHWDETVDPVDRIILNDAQTSGGLLIAIEPSKLPDLLSRLHQAGPPVTAAVIGEIADIPPGLVEVRE
jgi:selenide,water dikinase